MRARQWRTVSFPGADEARAIFTARLSIFHDYIPPRAAFRVPLSRHTQHDDDIDIFIISPLYGSRTLLRALLFTAYAILIGRHRSRNA